LQQRRILTTPPPQPPGWVRFEWAPEPDPLPVAAATRTCLTQGATDLRQDLDGLYTLVQQRLALTCQGWPT